MIRIQDDRFKKQAMGGGLTLDRAAVVVIGIDLRENRGGSPGIRCDIAYGNEDTQGKFQAFNYDDLQTTVPAYVEPRDFENCRSSAAAEMARLRGDRGPGPANLLEALVLWFESELVAQGKFGEGANVA